MFQVRKGDNAEWREADPDRIAAFFLHKNGGGYTERQTTNAMLEQREIIDGKTLTTASGLQIRWQG